jgi:hypothetical protein
VENVVPVGISTFALGVPNKFPIKDVQTPELLGVESVAKTVRSIATNELYTFPEKTNPEQVKQYVKNLLDSGHVVTHEIHILNGPGMRKGLDIFVNAVYGKTTFAEEYASDLNSKNPILMNPLRNLFAEVVSHARVLESYGAQVLICPELEDNHADSSESGPFGVYLQLLQDLGWNRGSIVRNSLASRSIGTISGIRYESHSSFSGLRPGDIFNLDGKTFVFANEPTNGCAWSESNVRSFIQQAFNSGVIFYMWHHELQGYSRSGCSLNFYPSYQNRQYIFRNPISVASMFLGVTPEQVELQ